METLDSSSTSGEPAAPGMRETLSASSGLASIAYRPVRAQP